MRLFIAIRFSREILDSLLRAQEQLRRVIDRAAGEAFPLAVSGMGRFGDLWWAGVEKNPALELLAERLRSGCRASGFRIDEKPFRAHVTLVRELRSDVPPRVNLPRTEMTVTRVSLMKSERIGGKLTYTEVYGRELG